MRPCAVLSVLVAGIAAAPTLRSFTLNMNTRKLALLWDEKMSAARANCDWSRVVLRTKGTALDPNGAALSYTQSEDGYGNPTLSQGSLMMTVVLHPYDRDNIAAAGVAQNRSYTWLFAEGGSFTSSAGKRSNAVYGTDRYGGAARMALKLKTDNIAPTLSKWILHRAEHAIYMWFSEAVDPSTAVASYVTLAAAYDPYGNATVNLRCASASRSDTASNREVVFALDSTCLNASEYKQVNVLGSTTSSWTEEVPWLEGRTDWERAAAVFGRGLQTNATALELTLTAGVVRDYAPKTGNLATAENGVAEGSPDCQPCGGGTFRSALCTPVYDATCSACRAECPLEQYRIANCTAESDLVCGECTPCRRETYQVSACGGADGSYDRVCAPCRSCGPFEFEEEDCRQGADRRCHSCARCDWGSEAAVWTERVCLEGALARRWRDEHCCRDSNEVPVLCSDLIGRELEIEALRAGRSDVRVPSADHPVSAVEAESDDDAPESQKDSGAD